MLKRPWIPVIALCLAAVGLILIPRGATGEPGKPASLAGTLIHDSVAPNFRLRDQFGKSVSLSQFRGHVVLLTFMEAHCNELCPRVADKLRRTVAGLGPTGQRHVTVLVVSTDPEGDTTSAVRQFSIHHGMLNRWHYLLGNRKQLLPVWQSYYIYAAPKGASASADQAHTSATYFIDQKGRERVLIGDDPDSVALDEDTRILLGLKVSSAASPPAPEVAHPAPDFSLPSVKGRTIRLSSLRGKVVLLNFWATWCTACKSEMPMLRSWYARLQSRGFIVLGVDQQEDRGTASAYMRNLKITYPVVLDQDGAVSARYNVVGLPTSLLIDREGTVSAIKIGALDNGFLKSYIDPLLSGAR
jgi:cytochrome oxidase Cu insertion factor (SCO1/SenC/PrrC family)